MESGNENWRFAHRTRSWIGIQSFVLRSPVVMGNQFEYGRFITLNGWSVHPTTLHRDHDVIADATDGDLNELIDR